MKGGGGMCGVCVRVGGGVCRDWSIIVTRNTGKYF